VYAATETASIASECTKHRMHLFEDLGIAEAVDEKNRPVPLGIAGAKVLVTVLFSRTIDAVTHTAIGKAPLIKARRRSVSRL
jgi:phenylacetate-CoA ligase